MNIAHIIGIFSPEHGGPVVSLRNYILGQSARGHDVSLFTVDGYPKTSPAIRLPENIDQHVSPIGWPAKLGRSRPLRRALERSAPADIYHLHGIWLRAMYYGYQKAKAARRPFLIEINGALDPLELETKPWRKRFVRRWFQDEMLRAASCIHVNSAREAEHLRELGFKNPIVVIPAGFHLEECAALTEKAGETPPAWARPLEGKKILLYLARIHQAKGIDDLLASWARLEAEFPDWTLLVVGPGDPEDVATRMAKCVELKLENRCVWTGLISDVDRAWAYANASIYVLPSHKENFGNTVQEALGYGTPVLTTRKTPWTELGEWRCGWVCDDNVESLTAELLRAMQTSQPELKMMGEAGREIIRRRFDLNAVVDDQIATYQWLRGGAPPACLWNN